MGSGGVASLLCVQS